METSEKVKTSKYLVFLLGDVRFAVPLGHVKEVIGKMNMTPMPQAPAYFKGLINVRGRIIHVIDLRERLQLTAATQEATQKTQKTQKNQRSSIVISELNDMIVGCIVDEVMEVRAISANQIESQVDIKSSVSREYITGIARFENYPITIILDIHKALDMHDVNLIRSNGAA